MCVHLLFYTFHILLYKILMPLVRNCIVSSHENKRLYIPRASPNFCLVEILNKILQLSFSTAGLFLEDVLLKNSYSNFTSLHCAERQCSLRLWLLAIGQPATSTPNWMRWGENEQKMWLLKTGHVATVVTDWVCFSCFWFSRLLLQTWF